MINLSKQKKEKIEPKKRGRPKKQLDGNKKQKESEQQKDPITRNRTKRKIKYEDETKNVFIGKPIKNISFINYAGYTDVSNTDEK